MYQILDDLVRAGKIRHYGVSVERIDEALEAIRYPGVETVQIIFNIFRPRPAEVFFPEALRRERGCPRARAAGQRSADRQADAPRQRSRDDDHRQFNRNGEAFDKGETFSGVPYEVGLAPSMTCGRSCPPAGRCRSSRCAGR